MVIRGLTDENRIRKNSTMVSGKVYLGKRTVPMKTKEGKHYNALAKDSDLKTYFRIETFCNQAKNVLAETYGVKPDSKGDILVEKLNIVLVGSTPEECFPHSMKSWATNELQVECDFRQILQKRELYTDEFGDIRPRYLRPDPNKPDDPEWQCKSKAEHAFGGCPLKCSPSGTLKFYIKELAESGISHLPAQLTITGATNFSDGGIWDALNIIYSKYAPNGFELSSNGFRPQTLERYMGSNILCTLTRQSQTINRPQLNEQTKARTGKKAKAIAYPIILNVNLEWEKEWRLWFDEWHSNQLQLARLKEYHELGISLDPKQLPSSIPMLEAPVVQALPAEPLISKEDINSLRELWVRRDEKLKNLPKEDFDQLLLNNFGIDDITNLPVSKLSVFKKFLETGELPF